MLVPAPLPASLMQHHSDTPRDHRIDGAGMSHNISDKEWKMLVAASGGYCAFPRCDLNLVQPGTNQDSAAFLGEAAHIVADSRQGPRGRSEMSDADRDKHTNLILLCGMHHKLI